MAKGRMSKKKVTPNLGLDDSKRRTRGRYQGNMQKSARVARARQKAAVKKRINRGTSI